MIVCACVWPPGNRRRRRPGDDAFQAAEALHDRADVDAERQRVVAGQLELVQERHVEVTLIAEASAPCDVAPLIQVAGRRPVRVVVVFAEDREFFSAVQLPNIIAPPGSRAENDVSKPV